MTVDNADVMHTRWADRNEKPSSIGVVSDDCGSRPPPADTAVRLDAARCGDDQRDGGAGHRIDLDFQQASDRAYRVDGLRSGDPRFSFRIGILCHLDVLLTGLVARYLANWGFPTVGIVARTACSWVPLLVVRALNDQAVQSSFVNSFLTRLSGCCLRPAARTQGWSRAGADRHPIPARASSVG